ncbi:MAG TPA: hypothetical protein ENG24_01805 [Thermoplasmatales archaeon]|nr:hypothetical protein [Thermoplasmatales archaeon]
MPEGIDDLEKDIALTVTQFVLKPEIPQEEQIYFKKFYVLFSKIAALGNIERQDIIQFKILFKIIAILLENGMYDYAHELMADFLMTLQLSRSIDGFWTLYGQRGIERVEHVRAVMERTRGKKSWVGRIRGMFSRGKVKEEPITEEEEY